MRRSSSRRAPQRRKLVWGRTLLTPPGGIVAGTQTLVPLLGPLQTALGADLLGCTVMRIRGNLGFRASAAGLGVRMTVGIGVFPALVAGVNIRPSAQTHLDWMYWKHIMHEPVLATEFATVNMLEVDVRARRKMEELDQTLFLVLDNVHATDAVNFSYGFSTLLALP